MVAWMFRFYENAKGSKVKEGELDVEEINRGEIALFQVIQKEVFGEKKTYKDLATVTDSHGLKSLESKQSCFPKKFRLVTGFQFCYQVVTK